MAKKDLLERAKAAGAVASDAEEDDYTAAELEAAMNPPERPAWEGSLSATEPIVAPDGHVVLSQEDIDRQKSGG